MEEEDGGGAFEDANGETTMTTPLSAIAEAFEELSRTVGKFNVNGCSDDCLLLKPFCDACSLVSVLFGSLGIAFKFAEYEYCSKVRFISPLSLDAHVLLYGGSGSGTHDACANHVRASPTLLYSPFNGEWM